MAFGNVRVKVIQMLRGGVGLSLLYTAKIIIKKKKRVCSSLREVGHFVVTINKEREARLDMIPRFQEPRYYNQNRKERRQGIIKFVYVATAVCRGISGFRSVI